MDLVELLVEMPERHVTILKIATDIPNIASPVIAISSPMGLEQTVSEGIVYGSWP